jgi:hypothetical protein
MSSPPLDGNAERAYKDGASMGSFFFAVATNPHSLPGVRRRAKPNAKEQARRIAWGQEWGRNMHEHALKRGWKTKKL